MCLRFDQSAWRTQSQTHKDCHCWYNSSHFPPIKCIRQPLTVLNYFLNKPYASNINRKIYCRLVCGHFVVMVAKIQLPFVHLYIVKGFFKLPVHYRNYYVYFIAYYIAVVKKGQLNVGSKFCLQRGTASVPFPTSLWSLFPIKTWIRNCVNTGTVIGLSN